MDNWSFAFKNMKGIYKLVLVWNNFFFVCVFVVVLGFFLHLKDRLAHHRWLLFFQFGESDKSNVQEFKKLKFLLKDEHIQVRLLTHLVLNTIYIQRTSQYVFCDY